jgi:hypothetical protein
LLLRGNGEELPSIEEDLPGIGPLEPGDQPKDRRLPAARWPEEAQEFTPLEFEAHLIDRIDGAELLLDLDDGEFHHLSPPFPSLPPKRSIARKEKAVTAMRTTAIALAAPNWRAERRP